MPAKKTSAKKPVKTAVKKQVRAASKAATSKGKTEAVVAEPAAQPPKPTEVKLSAAKGRPMLQWVGKKPLSRVTAFPAQLAETFDPSGELATVDGELKNGNLYYGDNKEVLAHLLANGYRGKVDLIYIDPPFDSGADYVRKVTLRGRSALAKLEGESYSLGEQVQYTDIWANDNYLQFMYERLILLKELLADTGSLCLHCDWRMVHRLRCILDEVFGADQFINEVAWKHTVLGGTHGRQLPKAHETILWYAKTDSYTFQADAESARVPFGDYIKKTLRQDEQGRWFYTRGRMSRTPTASEDAAKAHTVTYVDNPDAGTLASDIWDDLLAYRVYGDENVEYPTQKNESLIERFIALGTKPNNLVLDCFLGSGTTAAVAQKLGRRWIGCDINKGAIQTTSKRLQGIIREQLAEREQAAAKAKGDLFGGNDAGKGVRAPVPAALSFRIHRVNDYDLAIQHNEAVALACEHIGVVRTKTDTYFDGTQGKRLVKIIPFNHPLSLTDLEQLKTELKAREKEERDILLVCLGKELACEGWLADWSRLRKRGDVPNKIEVIELRTDPKYGKFMTHQPASAKVSVKRKGDGLLVTIEDFTSPTIIERLDSQDSRLFKAHVTDWRFLVDCVMIDPAYDGQSFNIALTDLPEKKTDLVTGSYTLPAPEGKTTVAVKIVDMLGEEVIHFAEV
jgi:DNA modification methylase